MYIKPIIYSLYNWNLKIAIIVSPDVIVKEKRKNNIAINTVTCSHLFLPSPCGSAMVLRVGSVGWQQTLGSGGGGLPVSGGLRWQRYVVHVDRLFFFTPESTWGHFCVFDNTLLYLCFFSTGLQLNGTSKLPYVGPFRYVRYSFFVLFAALKTNSVQAQVCISLTDPWEVARSCCGLQCKPSALSHVSPCLYSSILHPGSPFLKASAACRRPVFVYSMLLY